MIPESGTEAGARCRARDSMGVTEVPDGTSVPIARLLTEHLNFVVDMKGRS